MGLRPLILGAAALAASLALASPARALRPVGCEFWCGDYYVERANLDSCQDCSDYAAWVCGDAGVIADSCMEPF